MLTAALTDALASSLYMVMDFVEHDLKTLQEDMPEPFLPSEVKTLLQQLVSAVDFLHDQWILHVSLPTSFWHKSQPGTDAATAGPENVECR